MEEKDFARMSIENLAQLAAELEAENKIWMRWFEDSIEPGS